jgi:cation-transporting ATPase 13A3/4/5
VRSIFELLFLEILNPFYVFQFFSFLLWFIDDYVYYASAILLMSAIGVGVTIVQTRRV